MPYTLFFDVFPELAIAETRTIIVFEDQNIPPDQYALMENYCDENECDCRRVMFNVLADRRKEFVAVIAFGWETKDFYENWYKDNDPSTIKELMGPVLNLGSKQSPFAEDILAAVREVLEDKEYIERLKRHYKIFKEYIRNGKKKNQSKYFEKIGRNQICPCGSGKKYKHCCGN